ncbi:hypothetical protein [Chlamydia buteonis]|uniref:hypothetical protein n=1 Tax=Chlamydia buteonis TaxID=2494525 RepID=UPI00345048BE
MEKFEFLIPPKTLEDDLLDLNKQGILAGPEELKAPFLYRAQDIIDNAPDYPTAFPPRLQEIFDINPTHLEVIYSNEGMDVWEAGCTWITNNYVTIQLRKHLRKAARWFYMYSKEEILSHEAVHAARMKFYEPMFEEVLAYQTSPKVWRRFLGPLFRSPGEHYCLFFFVLSGLGLALWSPLVGLACILATPVYFGTRLLIIQSYFRRAMKKIRKMLGIPPLWVMLRLTDAEIRMFATQPIPVLEKYAREQKLESVRWQQIYIAYFT